MNKVFFTDLYLNITLHTIIVIFSLLTSSYILLDERYNILFRIICIIVLISTIFLILKKETFLPFLGATFLPESLLTEPHYPDGANLVYTINMSKYEDGTKVIYWASNNTGNVISNPYEAYDGYNNAGIAVVKKGRADIRIFCPDKYKVNKMFTVTLNKHFHYRIVCKNTGFIGPVQTFYVDC
jgi:hypothetical protein